MPAFHLYLFELLENAVCVGAGAGAGCLKVQVSILAHFGQNLHTVAELPELLELP